MRFLYSWVYEYVLIPQEMRRWRLSGEKRFHQGLQNAGRPLPSPLPSPWSKPPSRWKTIGGPFKNLLAVCPAPTPAHKAHLQQHWGNRLTPKGSCIPALHAAGGTCCPVTAGPRPGLRTPVPAGPVLVLISLLARPAPAPWLLRGNSEACSLCQERPTQLSFLSFRSAFNCHSLERPSLVLRHSMLIWAYFTLLFKYGTLRAFACGPRARATLMSASLNSALRAAHAHPSGPLLAPSCFLSLSELLFIFVLMCSPVSSSLDAHS